MTLEEYLMMVGGGNQSQPTQSSYSMSSPSNIDWRSISSGLSLRPEPLPKSALYGPMPEQPRMPLLPIRGGAQPVGMPMEEPPAPEPIPTPAIEPVSSVAMQAPIEPAPPITPQATVATQEQPQPVPLTTEQQQKKAAEEEAKKQEQERIKAWRPGQPFSINLADYGGEFTVKNYKFDDKAQDVARTSMVVQNAEGQEFTIPYTPETQKVFDTASQQFKSQYNQTRQATAKDDFGATIIVNGEKLPAKITTDANGLPQVIYRTKFGMPVAYPNFYQLEEGKTFVSPVDAPSALDQAKQGRQQARQSAIESVRQTGVDYQRTADITQLRQRLIPKYTTTEGDLPKIEWQYKTGTDTSIPLAEAEAQGYILPGTANALLQSESGLRQVVAGKVAGMKELQATQSKPKSQADLELIDSKIQAAQKELEGPTITAARKKQLEDDLKTYQSERGEVMNLLSGVGLGPGNTVVSEGGAPTLGFSLNPDTEQGRLALLSYQGEGKPSPQFTRDDWANFIIEGAKESIPTKPMVTTREYKTGTAALTNMLQNIDQAAQEQLGEQAASAWDDDATEFTYYDTQTGTVVKKTGSLTGMVNDYVQASNAYRQSQTPENKQRLLDAAQPLAGTVTMPSLDGESFQLATGSSYLRNIANQVYPEQRIDWNLPGRMASTAETVQIKAPERDIRNIARGPKEETPETTTAFTLFFTGGKTPYTEVNRGFNFAERATLTEENYNTLVDQYNIRNTTDTARKNIGRATFMDGGDLTPAAANAASKSIASANAAIVNNEDARRSVGNLIYKQLKQLGADMPGDMKGFTGTLEQIRQRILKGQSTQDLENILFGSTFMGTNSPAQNKFNGSQLGAAIRGKMESQPNYAGANGQTVLWDQMRGMVADAIQLWKLSASGTSSFKNNAGKTITWFNDPTSSDPASVQSVFTAPIATTVPTAAPLATKEGLNAAQATAASQTPIDSSLPTTLQNLRDFSTEYGELNKFLAGHSDAVSTVAEQQHKANLWDLNKNIRPETDKNTRFRDDSKNSSVAQFTNTILNYSLLSPYRIRTRLPNP